MSRARTPIDMTAFPERPVVRHAKVRDDKAALARHLRRHATDAEARAWDILRGRKLFGLKFRRQQAVAGFVVDFYCAELRLALEIDGAVHDEPARAACDAGRDEILRTWGIEVVRVPNAKVDESALRIAISAHLQRKVPLLKGEGPSRDSATG
jgi:very-short-patch-repair endonuclease